MGLKFTKRQWLTLIVMGLADFCNAICVSLQAPFFPQEAEKKGATATEYGLVFGVFELVVFLISPIYGQYLNRIGPKVLFNGGIFTTGASAILFGLLDKAPNHATFITLAFVIRIVEALGNAAFLTASFAIIAKEFPNNVATTFASLETFFGLGLIVGPMVGGALYSVGGYFLPFVVLGSSLFTCAILTLCVLPHHPRDPNECPENRQSMLKLLKIPGVLVCSLGICATSASIGFIGATLEPHLRQFTLTPVKLGFMFVINGAVYALCAPFVGICVDKFLSPKVCSFAGSIFITIGFCLIGPASFLPFETKINYVIYGLMLHGLGIALLLVSTFTDALRTCIQHGFNDGLETYGLISGLWTSTFAFGAFLGPSISGALYDNIGFRSSTIFIIALHFIVACVFIFYLCCEHRRPSLYKELSSEENLIKRSRENLLRSATAMDTSYRSNTSVYSVTDRPPVPIERGCAMNGLIMASSFGNKGNHWQRMEENNTLLQEPGHETQHGAYGSFDIEYIGDEPHHRETIS